jgi:hypothetical protein
MINKIIIITLFVFNNLNAKPLTSIYNNQLCILEIKANLHIDKQGLCPKISELSYFFEKPRDLEEVIEERPTFLSDKFNGDKKIIPYFGQYFNFIDTTMYFKIKDTELDNRLLYILLKNQVVYINDNILMFNKLIKIEKDMYIGVNQFNFKANEVTKKLFQTLSEHANELVYIYDNDF